MTDTARMDRDLRQRHPEVFRPGLFRRHGAALLFCGTVFYLLYAAWFFDLPRVVAEAHWERFGVYMSQWVSYAVRPEFRRSADGIELRWPSPSVLGDDPHPDWIAVAADGRHTVIVDGAENAVSFDVDSAEIVRGGEHVGVRFSGETPVLDGPAPAWLVVHDDEVLARMGFAGEVRVTADRVRVNKRFLGWANFVFDTKSSFFGRPAGEVLALVVGGPDLEPGKPNWRLAFDDVWTNAEWQHGDVWVKLLQTLVMAFLGTLLGAFIGFPLAFLAARNITPNRLLNQAIKRFFDFLRSIDMLIWALFFTRAFGPGPLAGSTAIFFTETGTLGKIYSEALENVDDKPREGVRSTGAPAVLVQRFGVLPEVIPVMVSQTLYQWESNTRGATIIGAVGAGGIGLKLWEAMRTNANWANVCYMVLLILIVVFAFDNLSRFLRTRLIGSEAR